MWLPKLGLDLDDKLCLNRGKWLTDKLINACQKMLQLSHPEMGGLQDTVLAETLSFNIQQGEFVQVLNILGNHWLTVLTVGCQPGLVNIYDSIRSISVPTRTKEQISTIMFAQQKAITLIFSTSPISAWQ